ncbi:hypothetical protein [Bradyrhizobium sp. SZCCHNRI20481]|uniref:hypothetical protein n=1 Tax=Bradyrhizobium sp. SZCCHNRI20481 TaxID=3057286 RepID=UPI002915E0A8|nr:hypothetical protein [Bradyrhizobium sp. SZCCHNRI20481]
MDIGIVRLIGHPTQMNPDWMETCLAPSGIRAADGGYTIGNNYPWQLTDAIAPLEQEFGRLVQSSDIRNLPSHTETLCCRGALFLRSLRP